MMLWVDYSMEDAFMNDSSLVDEDAVDVDLDERRRGCSLLCICYVYANNVGKAFLKHF